MRQNPKDRKADILAAAVRMSALHGYHRVTREDIALAAKCSPTLVTHYFSTMTYLRRAIMRAAIHTQCLAVVAQGLAMADPVAQKAPQAVRDAAVATLA